ncbi:MAG: hypothetical protein AB7F86_19530 [Bdellovibrionales bacterium]
MKLATLIFYMTLFSLFCGGCVTVSMGTKSGKRASGVEYKEPMSPFERDSREDVDAAWKNTKNGNLISFLSDCQDPSDPPLDQIVGSVISDLSQLKIMNESSLTYQGRAAKRVHAAGTVDGVPSEIDLLAFKRNHCIYILTYVGVSSSFQENHETFDRFLQRFRAP